MPQFRYRALDAAGGVQQGRVEAASASEVPGRLRSQGLWPVEIEAQAAASGVGRSLWRMEIGARKHLKSDEIAFFCRQMETLLGAGVSLLRALDLLNAQSRSTTVRTLIVEVRTGLIGGQPLGETLAVAKVRVPALMVGLVRAGEAGGFLEEAFARLASHFEREHVVAQKMRTALTYPKVVVTVAVGVALAMVTLVLPKYVALFNSFNAPLPAVTRLLLRLSSFILGHVLILVVAAALLWSGVTALLKLKEVRQPLDFRLLRAPIFGRLLQAREGARFGRTLATLLQSGVPMLTALDVARGTVTNVWVRERLQEVEGEVRRGEPLSSALAASGALPSLIHDMVAVGETSGALADVLHKVAEHYEREVDRTVDRLGSLIEPVMVLLLGGMVGFLLISIYLPMFQMFKTIQ